MQYHLGIQLSKLSVIQVIPSLAVGQKKINDYQLRLITLTETLIILDITKKIKSAYEPIVAHQAGAYPGFCSMK